jgi:putative spermidine/putrescine transport system ATP-binding protein
VRRGEFIALLGPSGCGKSTALNCIAGLLPLSEGQIFLDEQRVDQLPPERRGFGMVFQNYALFPHMTVARNVGFGLLMRKVPRAEIDQARGQGAGAGAAERPRRKLPGQLSGGQQQRVAIARAIVIEPPLVLMDEPLSNLDAKLRLEMRTEIRRIHGELGRTTIYVTHDQDEALSLADRIVVMKDGRVQQVGTPATVYAQPASLAVARFMGYRNEMPLAPRPMAPPCAWPAPASRWRARSRAPRPPGRWWPRSGPTTCTSPMPPRRATPACEATVEGVEYYGKESLFMLRTDGGVSLFVRTVGNAVAPAIASPLAAPPDRVLVFPREAAA